MVYLLLLFHLQVTRGDIKFHDGHVELDYRHASKILNRVAKKVIEKGLPSGVDLLNLNIPSHPSSDKIKLTRLGDRMYKIHIEKRLDPRGRPYYWIDGIQLKNDEYGTDVHAIKGERCATFNTNIIRLYCETGYYGWMA